MGKNGNNIRNPREIRDKGVSDYAYISRSTACTLDNTDDPSPKPPKDNKNDDGGLIMASDDTGVQIIRIQ